MPFRGFSCPTAEFCGFFASYLRDVLILFCDSQLVDKSVRRPTRRITCQVIGESAFQLCELGQERIEIVFGRTINLFDIKEICIRHDDGPPLPDSTVRDQPIDTNPA
jgi:hypothetical protein